MKRLVPGLVIGALILGTSAVAAQSATLDAVRDRGALICGVSGQQPGMSTIEEDGSVVGMDADYCRGVAAAIGVDDVDFRPLNADQRATAIQTGEIDVLFRNTTNKLSRDSTWGDFGPTVLYDGQGMMVPNDSPITTLQDLDGATICVTAGTTTEQNLADQFSFLGLAYTPAVFSEADTVYATYEEGACDAVTSDKSQLIGRKSIMADPAAHRILDVTMSKEPLAPVTANGDNTWGDIIRWVVYATIQAEELGITQANVDDFRNSDNPVVSRFLGDTGELGSALGISDNFAVDVIKAIGNYGEIYDRHFGPDALDLPRAGTLNDLWTNGGLQYSPPFS